MRLLHATQVARQDNAQTSLQPSSAIAWTSRNIAAVPHFSFMFPHGSESELPQAEEKWAITPPV